jgi:hypothetical protein
VGTVGSSSRVGTRSGLPETAAVDEKNEMAHAPLGGGLDQRARVHRIVAVIAERIANGVRHDDRGGEMEDGVDPVLCDRFGDARLISMSPIRSDAAGATAQSKPVVRLSSTTTRSPASTST